MSTTNDWDSISYWQSWVNDRDNDEFSQHRTFNQAVLRLVEDGWEPVEGLTDSSENIINGVYRPAILPQNKSALTKLCERISTGRSVDMGSEAEPTNPVDTNAVRLFACVGGLLGRKKATIGYVPRKVAERIDEIVPDDEAVAHIPIAFWRTNDHWSYRVLAIKRSLRSLGVEV